MVRHIGKMVLGASLLALAGACTFGSKNSGKVWQQGWTLKETKAWSYASQGSRLMPASWFEALEQPEGGALFSDLDYLTSFGYLAPPADWDMTRPIGFVADAQNDSKLPNTKLRWFKGQSAKEEWIGFNCSACHTAQIDIPQNDGSVATRIVQGAPGMGDFQSFIGALNTSLQRTLDDDARFNRFAARVLEGSKDTTDNRTMLRGALGELVNFQNRVAHPNRTDSEYGFARVDAVGYILNKTLVLANPDREELQGNPSDAPVSYPFLWNIFRENHLQYNGMVAKQMIDVKGLERIDVGGMGRNAGEVIGVFGDVDPKAHGFVQREGDKLGVPIYRSSIRVKNLNLLEETLARLTPPMWTEMVGPLDGSKVAAGKVIYDQQCASCHIPEEQWASADWPKGKGTDVMIPLKTLQKTGDLTDTQMACNAFNATGPTGQMADVKGIAGEEDKVANMLTVMVKGTLVDKLGDLLAAGFENVYFPGRLPVVDGNRPAAGMVLAEVSPSALPEPPVDQACIDAKINGKYANHYKARPLDGIWATAPYLHNGSVPTLYHLLLAPKDRPTSFYVGDTMLDTANVGLVWRDDPDGTAFKFEVRDSNGMVVTGNGNQGHDYGVSKLTEEQRQALLEYLKSL